MTRKCVKLLFGPSKKRSILEALPSFMFEAESSVLAANFTWLRERWSQINHDLRTSYFFRATTGSLCITPPRSLSASIKVLVIRHSFAHLEAHSVLTRWRA